MANTAPTGPLTQSFVYRGVYDKILKEAMYPFYLLTALQITRLLYPSGKLGMLSTVKERLKVLTHEKYLKSYALPTAEGQRPHVYSLALRGERLFVREGFDLTLHHAVSAMQERSYAWQYHLLELNNVFITARIIETVLPGFSLFDFQHDYSIKKHPATALDLTGKVVQIEPDGFLDILSASGKHTYFLLELDRATHSNETFRKKLRETIICFQQSNLTTHFNARKLTILYFTTKGEKRVEQMRHLARLEFQHLKLCSKDYEARMFKFGHIPPLSAPQLSPKTFFCSPC